MTGCSGRTITVRAQQINTKQRKPRLVSRTSICKSSLTRVGSSITRTGCAVLAACHLLHIFYSTSLHNREPLRYRLPLTISIFPTLRPAQPFAICNDYSVTMNMNIFRILGDVSHTASKCILIWAIHSNKSSEGTTVAEKPTFSTC